MSKNDKMTGMTQMTQMKQLLRFSVAFFASLALFALFADPDHLHASRGHFPSQPVNAMADAILARRPEIARA